MTEGLPQGWVQVFLTDVATMNMGQSPASSTYNSVGQGLPFYQGKAEFGDLYPTVRKFCSAPIKIAEPGDILLSVRAPVGPTNLCPERSCIGRGLAAIQAFSEIPNKYLFYYFMNIEEWLSTQGTGSTFSAISKADIENVELPLPPLSEQKRIVAKLEKLLDRVNSCQQRLAKIPVLLKRFRQSVLAAACSGRLTADWREENPDIPQAVSLISEIKKAHVSAGGHKRGNAASPTEEAHDLTKEDLPDNWEIAEMRDIVIPDRPITYGILKPGPDVPDGIPYIRVADFPNDKISIESIRRTTREIDSTFSRSKLREGDILLSIRGTVGRVCIVPHELENANITQDSARLSIQPLMNTNYIAWVLRATTTQNRMQKAIKGVAIRGINIGDVRALQIPIPPLPEQEEIVRRVESLFSLVDQIESRLARATDQVNRLTSSILAKAFRGELVPQDPDDEPASVLLERIRQTRKPTK
ncbi:MAG: restriction endonuclease subunit S [Syntrophales bacterium]